MKYFEKQDKTIPKISDIPFVPEGAIFVENFKDNMILQGLGELVEEDEKNWIKKSLRSEVAFFLRSYAEIES